MIFRKPIDADRGLTEEEREEKLAKFRANEFDRDDERAMIWAALKVFLPVVIGVMAIFVLVMFLVLKLWGQ